MANFGLLVAPGPGVTIASVPDLGLGGGFYEVEVIWGNLRTSGASQPGVEDLANWKYVCGSYSMDLVSLGENPLRMKLYAELSDGDTPSIKTKTNGANSVVYAAGLVVTRLI